MWGEERQCRAIGELPCKKDPARLLKPKGASHKAADQQIFWASLSIFWKRLHLFMFTSSPYVLCSCELWGCASVFLSHTFISEKGFLRSVTKTAASEHGRALSCVVPTKRWRSAPFNGALRGWAACATQTDTRHSVELGGPALGSIFPWLTRDWFLPQESSECIRSFAEML